MPTVDPILLVVAKPSYFKGRYHATCYVFARTKAEAVAAFARVFHGSSLTDAFSYTKKDVGRDPYLGMAYGGIECTKDALEQLRRAANASFCARSPKATSGELLAGLAERRPLHAPTEAMWRKAIGDARGFGDPPTEWLVTRIARGEQEPDERVTDEAYRLMAAENAKRASTYR